MRYHTKHVAQKIYDEIYDCRDCGNQHESYEQLHHPDEHTGGFCTHCGSEQLDVLVLKTVYQEVWVREDDDAIEVAHQVENWKVSDNTYKIGERIDDKNR